MSYYRPQVPDLVGGAIDTATKMYGLLNAPEDRRRKQAQEDMAMETARLHQDTAKLNIETARSDKDRAERDRVLAGALYKYQQGVTDFSDQELQAIGMAAKDANNPWLPSDLSEVPVKKQAVSVFKMAMDKTVPTLLQQARGAGGLVPIQEPTVLQGFNVLEGERAFARHQDGSTNLGFSKLYFDTSDDTIKGEFKVRAPDGTIYEAPATEPDETGNRKSDNARVRAVPLHALKTKIDATSQFMDMVEAAGGWEKVLAAGGAISQGRGVSKEQIEAAIVSNGGTGASAVMKRSSDKAERKEQFAAIEKSDFISQLPPAYQGAAKSFVSFFKATGGDPTQLKQQLGTLMTKAAELEVSESEMAEILPAYQKALRAVQNVKGSPSARESKAFEAINKMGMRSTTGLKVMEMVRASIASDIKAEEAEANRQATVKAAAIKAAGGGGVQIPEPKDYEIKRAANIIGGHFIDNMGLRKRYQDAESTAATRKEPRTSELEWLQRQGYPFLTEDVAVEYARLRKMPGANKYGFDQLLNLAIRSTGAPPPRQWPLPPKQ